MFPQRLRLARKRAGLSLRDLAERMGGEVTHQAIKKYEDGVMYPSSRVLVSLGQALDVSLDFLMSSQVEGLAGVEFRQHSGTTKQDRARVEAAVIDAVERYLEVEGVLGLNEDQVDLGSLREHDPVASMEDAEARAGVLRDYWGLGGDPIPSVTALLEEKGFKVVEVDLPEHVAGLTCTVEREGEAHPLSVIIISRHNHNVEHRRFTLTHELAHAVMPRVAAEMKKEHVMHRFAGAFLVPAKHVRDEVGDDRRAFAYREIIRLKQLYGVSAASLLMRLRDLNMLSPEAVTNAFRTYARRWRTEEPEPMALGERPSFEQPMRFEQLVYRALAELMISLPRAAELLNCPLQHVELEVRGPGGGRAARYEDHPE